LSDTQRQFSGSCLMTTHSKEPAHAA
jgi:hypothetical protein